MTNNITLENYESQLETICKQSVSERDTKTILNLFFTHYRWDDKRIRKNGRSFDNPQLYQYEIKIGKKLFEMTSDEILSFFKDRGKRDGKTISSNSYRGIMSLGKAIWNYYIEYISSDVRNPWIRDEMKIDTVMESFIGDNPKITEEFLERIIEGGRAIYINDDEHYKYGELFVRLIYCGISSPKEFISIKESQIDFSNHCIRFSYKDVYLSDRVEKLLKEVHTMGKFTSYKQVYYPVFYNGSYIPIIVKKGSVDCINERPIKTVANTLTNMLSTFTNKQITLREIYKLGFFDFIVRKIGIEEARNILSNNDTQSSLKLIRLVGEYGYTVQVAASVRRDLKMFL